MTDAPTSMIEGWVPDLSRGSGPIYLAVADALGSAIGRGELRAGDRLPPQRELALRLGVDLTTITRAYDAARNRGLIEARGRSGSFVRAPAPKVAQESRDVDTGMNMPPDLPSGQLTSAMLETSARLLRDEGAARLQYQVAGGRAQDRATGVQLLQWIGLAATEEETLVAAGGQNALHSILSLALQQGDAVACRSHVYPGFKAVCSRLGLRLVALPELTAPALSEAAKSGVKALYVVPTNDNPTTQTLSAEERERIAEVARELGVQIVEDDAYGALASRPVPPIASFAPECSWYIASQSKIISPALRVAYVRAPNARWALQLAAECHETAIMAPPLNAAMLTSWVSDGTYAQLVDAMRREAQRRQAIARELLVDLDFDAHPDGYHLWLRLSDAAARETLVEASRGSGLSVVSAGRFAAGEASSAAVRISLGGLLDEQRLTRGLKLVHAYAHTPPARAALLV